MVGIRAMRYESETYAIIGAAMEVHRVLGVGFTEYVYQDALEMEFQRRGIPYEREKRLRICYKDVVLKHDYVVDFLCYGTIIVECKATVNGSHVFEAQTINYIRLSNLSVGLLLNFGQISLSYKRLYGNVGVSG